VTILLSCGGKRAGGQLEDGRGAVDSRKAHIWTFDVFNRNSDGGKKEKEDAKTG
jgi:hypothetical protein